MIIVKTILFSSCNIVWSLLYLSYFQYVRKMASDLAIVRNPANLPYETCQTNKLAMEILNFVRVLLCLDSSLDWQTHVQCKKGLLNMR